MREKGSWTIRSFITCFVLNAAMLGVFFLLAKQILHALHLWVNPFLASGGADLPDDLRSAVSSMNQFINEAQLIVAPLIFGIGGAITLVLWLIVMVQGRGLVDRAGKAAVAAASPPDPSRVGTQSVKEERREPLIPPERIAAPPSLQPAVQMLGILQREGRLIDFLQEDLSLYEDAQIGAAVRNVHQGCKDVLKEYVDLRPVFEALEGSEVTVPTGFDSRAIRLTGNVVGDPPFKGIIRHRGWRVTKIDLPQVAVEQKKDWVVAPAEVEVGA